uniref:RRM domain-containing protein n=1 Tax=Zea mays TaxID=4577 RepID=A0A804P4S6_MAIZE
MRPVFCGNLDYDVRISEVERLFGKYGRVERVDLKTGFAFIYMEDERDAEDAISRLDGIDFGRKGRRIKVEWTKEDRTADRRGNSRRSPTNAKPTKTLFVINFDPINTRIRDLERHFDKYGRVANVRIKKNFAFIQFEAQEDATRALEGANGSHFMDRVISVEYALRDDDEKGERATNGYSPDRRGRERSPGARRSPSPYGRGRERGSPDYGRGRPAGGGGGGRGDHARGGGRRRSPDYYDRERREASPGYDRPPSCSPGTGRDARD